MSLVNMNRYYSNMKMIVGHFTLKYKLQTLIKKQFEAILFLNVLSNYINLLCVHSRLPIKFHLPTV